MPDTRTDVRVERSRAQLVEALRTLLRTRDARDISVSALCAEAGVSRPTFYQHFANLDEVAVAGIEERFARLRAELSLRTRRRATGRRRRAASWSRFLEELDGERASWQRTIGSGTAFSASRDAVETLARRPAGRAARPRPARPCSGTPPPGSSAWSGPGCCRTTGPTGRALPSWRRAWRRSSARVLGSPRLRPTLGP